MRDIVTQLQRVLQTNVQKCTSGTIAIDEICQCQYLETSKLIDHVEEEAYKRDNKVM